MILDYLVHHDEYDDRWHVCYFVPGSDQLASVMDCPSRQSATSERLRIIAEAKRENSELLRLFDRNRKFRPRRFNNEHDD